MASPGSQKRGTRASPRRTEITMIPNNHTIDIRDAFFDMLYQYAQTDTKVIVLTADMGAQSLEQLKHDFPRQYINTGIAEQNMISIAAGLALSGCKVFAYGIIPFVTFRCFEQIKVDLCSMHLPVTIIGVGPGVTYASDGPTHHGTHDISVMRVLPGITILNPSDSALAQECANICYQTPSPTYVRIDKGIFPQLYSSPVDCTPGLHLLRKGTDLTIIATGTIVHTALDVAKKLDNFSISSSVIDLYRIKPLNAQKLIEYCSQTNAVVSLEEHTLAGGLGSIIAECLNDHQMTLPLKRIGFPDEHCLCAGERKTIQENYGLSTELICNTITSWHTTCKQKKG